MKGGVYMKRISIIMAFLVFASMIFAETVNENFA